MPLIRWLGSLSFTVLICVVMIGLLIVSTTMESKLGTDMAQKVFYQARWFDFVLSLFWVNIFCSTILRFPFQPGHVGFIITHVGILALLMGALMARIGGVEGRMVLFEGETSKGIVTGGYHLSVKGPDGQRKIYALSGKAQKIPADVPNVDLRIGQALEHAAEEEAVSDGGLDAPLNRAVQVSLRSEMMEMEQNFWLIEESPLNPDADAMVMGPAHFLLKAGQPAQAKIEKPTLVIKGSDGQTLLTQTVEGSLASAVMIPGTGLKIENLKYFPQAAVDGRELVNGPEGTPDNPAVVFDIVDGAGARQKVIKFALFPDFESMHAKGGEAFPVTVEFQVPAVRKMQGVSSLAFFYWPDGRWTYETVSKDGEATGGDLKVGVKVPLDWADMTFEVVRMLDRADVDSAIVASKNGQGPFAVELVTHYKGQDYPQWLAESQNVTFKTDEGNYRFSVEANTADLPFALTLKDFRKVDYPGTMSAASYESDVTLEGLTEEVKMDQTIAMNQPLDYQGYRIFQSSFIEDNGSGEASIFTVSKNPGIPLIYIGSIVIFIGAAYQFYGPKNGWGRKKDDEDII